MTTVGNIFCGGGGWEVGALAVGLRPLWGIDTSADALASLERYVAPRAAGHRALRADARDVDPATLTAPDLLIASPPCPAHSKANKRAGVRDRSGEADLGLELARYAKVLRPAYALLENVPPYRAHASFAELRLRMHALGYHARVELLDAAHHGTPSSRQRLVACFRLGALPPPVPARTARRGWLATIEDLLPALPDATLAPWQRARVARMLERLPLARLPKFPWLVSSNNASTTSFNAGRVVRIARGCDEPGWCVCATYYAMTQSRVLHGDGRVQQLSVRALARLAGFPDDYALDAHAKPALRVVGNAVPPPLAAALCAQAAEAIGD